MEITNLKKKEFLLGIEVFDNGNQKFVDLLNEFGMELKKPKEEQHFDEIFFSFAFYIEKQLLKEEIYMREIAFSGFQEHQNHHQRFIKAILRWQKSYENGNHEALLEMHNFLMEWFENHIMKYDSQVVNEFKKRGLQ